MAQKASFILNKPPNSHLKQVKIIYFNFSICAPASQAEKKTMFNGSSCDERVGKMTAMIVPLYWTLRQALANNISSLIDLKK